MIRVSTFTLRDNLSEYIRKVAETETPILVERYGKPVATIIPYDNEIKPDYNSYFGFMGIGGNGEKFLKRVRRSSKEASLIKKFRNCD